MSVVPAAHGWSHGGNDPIMFGDGMDLGNGVKLVSRRNDEDKVEVVVVFGDGDEQVIGTSRG